MAMEDPDVVPGTVYLVDVPHQLSQDQRGSTHGDIVLVPRPSDDPEDPLNWSWKRKFLVVCMAYLYVLGTGIPTSLQYSVLADITMDTGISINVLVQGTGVMFLFFGWFCLFWQPIALTYGRRGVYLISLLLTIPIMVWTAYSNTAGQWYGHRVLVGIVCSPIESLPEVTIFDVFFAHNRGAYMSGYVLSLLVSNLGAPIAAGWFNDAYGWRWTMIFGAIIAAFFFVILFFFMEETMYFRDPARCGLPVSAVHNGNKSDSEATGMRESEGCNELKEGKAGVTSSMAGSTPVSDMTKPAPTLYGRMKPFRRLPGRPTICEMLTMMYRPIFMVVQFPCTTWAGFLYGINLIWFNVLNGTASPVLSSPPYSWSPSLVGSVYAGPIVGALVMCLWSGYGADRFTLWMARRNGGIREAEHRLWPLTVSGVILAAGLITWGVGAYHHVHWVGLVFGLGMLTFGIGTSASMAVAYNVDCFKELGGETTVSVMLVRNTMSFAFSYGITPWWTNLGVQNCFIMAGIFSLLCSLTFLLMVKYGKRLRRHAAKKGKEYLSSAPAVLLEH